MTTTAAPDVGTGGRPPRRRGLRVLVGVVLALAVLYAVAAAAVAFQIRADVFAVRPWPPTTAEVVDVGGGRITLDNAVEPGPSSWREARYALSWDGGYAELGGPAEVDDTRVTRELEVMRGTEPAPGDTVTLDRNLVDAESDEPLVATEEVSYPSGRGALTALYAEPAPAPGAEPSTTWAILVHGKGAPPAEMLRMAQATTAAGLPTLSINYRNDPGTSPDPSGRHAFGQTEWRDLEAAVAYARSEGAESVVLGGASMGGGIVAAYLENADREPGLVRGVILDAPMLDLPAVVDYGASRVELPMGLRVPSLLTQSGRQVVALLDGVDWDALSYLDDTSWLQVPALVLHTSGDTTVPVTISRELAEIEPDLVRLEEFDGEHVEAYNADPERYQAAVTSYLEALGL
jgi:pimeloyl-ACP methyl ester carboxylesterase